MMLRTNPESRSSGHPEGIRAFVEDVIFDNAAVAMAELEDAHNPQNQVSDNELDHDNNALANMEQALIGCEEPVALAEGTTIHILMQRHL